MKISSNRICRVAPYKILLVMKLTLILLVTTILQASAVGYAQKITLSKKNATLEQVFWLISNQSEYEFIYGAEILKEAKPVNVEFKNSTLENVLKKCFAGQPLTYTINDNTITVTRKPLSFLQPAVPDVLDLIREKPPVTITGQVKDANGATLPGVSIKVKGTALGTTTDLDGKYSITVPDNSGILVFSYIGFVSQEVPLNNRTSINVTLEVGNTALNEVVVTALGIEREARSLTYSTQSVDNEKLAEARELNMVNSLQGKVAGLSINTSGAGVGGSARVILRGNRSIYGDSQPLYVVDGVSITGSPADLNPDNIASINVLKGANAAALYGSAAQNGAIIIETKRGSAGVTNISLNQSSQLLAPILSMKFQDEYAQGISGVYLSGSESSWGPKMTGQTVNHWSLDAEDAGKQYALSPQPNNVRDFFQNGFNTATNLFASVGSEKIQGVFSLTRTDANGIVPGNSLGRNNIAVRLTGKLTNKLSIDAKLDYMHESKDNATAEDIGNNNPLKQIYLIPRSIRTEDAMKYTFIDDQGEIKQNYWNRGSSNGLNPYFLINRGNNYNTRHRGITMGSLSYAFSDSFRFMVRGSYDFTFNKNESKFSKDFNSSLLNGMYAINKNDYSLFNADFLMTYNKKITNDLSFNLNVGGNTQQQRNHSFSANTNVGMIVPDLFTLSNTLAPAVSDSPGPEIDIQSLYSFGQINWKNALFLDVTGRNDWSSTLPAANRSYFYPSIGLSAIVSELIPEFPEQISFAKLWGSWAKVGSGGPAYMLARTGRLVPGGNNGFLQINSILPNSNLRPEETNALELGLNLGFFNDRLGLKTTWYKTNTLNQLFTIALPPGSGATSFFTNGGDVENKGVEIELSSIPVKYKDFRWEADVNFSRNRNMVNKLNDERPKLVLASDASFRDFVVEQGQPFGQIYSIGFLRDDQGRVIVGSNGVPKNTGSRSVSIANANPDWMGSISSTFHIKNFSLSFLIDHRQGGKVISVTNSMLMYEGMMAETLAGREGGLVFGENLFPGEVAVKEDGTPNDIALTSQTFWHTIGGYINPIGEAFVESMTNTRLREVTLGYTLPRSLLGNLPVSSARLSLVGRNLFFIHRASQTVDPDIIVGSGVISEGQSSFAPPTTRSFGLNLKINF